MDYQKVINTLKDEIKCSCYRNRGYCGICTIYSEMDRNNIIDACKTAISAMQELREYKQLGTLEEMKLLKATHLTGVELAQISCMLKQLAEYEKIGTLEEVREVVERQKEKKVADIRGNDKLKFCTCPSCGKRITNVEGGNYCQNCGQKLDWSEEE